MILGHTRDFTLNLDFVAFFIFFKNWIMCKSHVHKFQNQTTFKLSQACYNPSWFAIIPVQYKKDMHKSKKFTIPTSYLRLLRERELCIQEQGSFVSLRSVICYLCIPLVLPKLVGVTWGQENTNTKAWWSSVVATF